MALPRVSLVVAVVCGCSSAPPPAPHPAPTPPAEPVVTEPPRPAPDHAFEVMVQGFLDHYFQLEPVDATTAGEHRYDRNWPDFTPAGDTALRKLYDDTAKQLSAFSSGGLDEQNAIDAAILDDVLRYKKFELDTLKGRDGNPMTYTGTIGEGLDPLVNRNFATPELRIDSLRGRLEAIPAIVEAAKARLQHPAK
ncbi:MAG TPA: DUF885 family protein, partial [Kofleriaceae bacterium]|nr:DUF885 family protein [Kofleriaceae bacterium]